MRILLSNWDMNARAGTQRWVGTMASELMARGHSVSLMTIQGNTLYPWIPAHEDGATYDLGLLNHNDVFKHARKVRMGTCIITAHGFTPRQEWVSPGADAYVAVDELTAAHIPWKATVIRNPVDLEQFRELRPISRVPRRATFLSNKQGAARDLIEKACQLARLELQVVGGETAVEDPSDAINWADIVFTIGRGAIEAMACNRNVFVLDLYGAKGFINPENVERMRADSYAGLLDGTWPSPEELSAALEGYDPDNRMRQYVEESHSPGVVADHYLELAATLPTWRKGAGRVIRRLGPPLTSRRMTKAFAHARLGNGREALAALQGDQSIPPLFHKKLPRDVAISFPPEGFVAS